MLIRILTLVVLASSALWNPEYYSILGLRHRADKNEIKKAFKKLAVKYHPDKAPEGQKEEFNKKFSEISDAYSILSDVELKNAYDRGGHEGIKQYRENSHWQEQQQARQEAHATQSGNLFDNTDVEKLNHESLGRFYRRTGVWVIVFYRVKDSEMHGGLKNTVTDLNTKFYGIFTTAVVNWDEDEAIWDEYHASNTPDIFIFSSNFNSDGIRYTGEQTVGRIAGFAVELIENFVSIATPDNLQTFLDSNSKTKILIFSTKKDIAPVFKVLSKEFRNHVEIGFVKDDKGIIRQMYNIATMPSVIAIKGSEITKFDGTYTKNELTDFIRKHRGDGTGASSSSGRIGFIEYSNDISKIGCSKASKKIWIIALYDSESEKEKVQKYLQSVLASVMEDPVILLLMDKRFLDFYGIGASENTRYLAFKPNKLKYTSKEADHFDLEQFELFLENILGGNYSYKSYSQDFASYIKEKDEVDL